MHDTKPLLHFHWDINAKSLRNKILLALAGPTSYEKFVDYYKDRAGKVDFSAYGPVDHITNTNLNIFIQYVYISSPISGWYSDYFLIDEVIEKEYTRAFMELPIRIRNTVFSYFPKNLASFYLNFINGDGCWDIKRFRNIGTKSIEQVEALRDKMKALLEKGPADLARAKLINLSPPLPEKKKFNIVTREFFSQLFGRLSPGSRQSLKDIGAHTIEGFTIEFLLMPENYRTLRYRLLDPAAATEVGWMREEFILHLRTVPLNLAHGGLFSTLASLFETDLFTLPQQLLLDNRLLCYKDSRRYTLTSLQKQAGLTGSYLGQKEKTLIPYLMNLVNALYRSTPSLRERYFKGSQIIPDEELAERINEDEKTRFSSEFIMLMLSMINDPR